LFLLKCLYSQGTYLQGLLSPKLSSLGLLIRKLWMGLKFLFIALVLVACSTSRYSMDQDVGPVGEFDASNVPDAVPVWEPMSRKGNKSPYTVRGETYNLLPTAVGYEEIGVASWYGLKFHGELTSNGEIYNIYDLTAAHKTLPLPSFLRVTNLENQKSIVVRVNDRGPFHSDRVIDLSYAAAKKLGYERKGTAKVKLEALTVGRSRVEGQIKSVGESALEVDRISNFIQVGAFSNKLLAEGLVAKLKVITGPHSVFLAPSKKQGSIVYRVRIGPIDDDQAAQGLLSSLKKVGNDSAMLITRAVSAQGR